MTKNILRSFVRLNKNLKVFCIPITFHNPIKSVFRITNILLQFKHTRGNYKQYNSLFGFLKIISVPNKLTISFGKALV